MQCACAILSSMACMALHIYPTLSHKRNDFRGGGESVNPKNECFDFLHNFCQEKHFLFYEELSEIWSKMYIGLHVKYPSFLSDLKTTWIFWTVFRNKTQISNFIKIRPVGKQLFHGDRRTDMTKLTVAFRNFANSSKYESFVPKIK
jgi:hypothetical protein